MSAGVRSPVLPGEERAADGRGTARAKDVARRHGLPLLVLMATAMILVGSHMLRFQTLSVIDENAHFDYIVTLPDVPNTGDRLTQPSMRVTACRGYPADFEHDFPPCATDRFDPNSFPAGGYSTAGTTPPAYYVATWLVAAPVALVTGRDLFTVSRAVGGLWLAGFMLVIYLLARRLSAPRLAATGVALLVGSSSDVVSASSTIGPDIAAGMASGVVLLLALRYDGGRRTALLLLGGVALAALTKMTTFTGVGAAAVLVALQPLLSRSEGAGRDWWRSIGLATGMVGLFSVLSALWIARPLAPSIESASEIPINQMFAADSVPWGTVLTSDALTFLSPIVGNFNAPYLEGVANNRLESFTTGVLLLGLLAAVLAVRDAPRLGALGIGLLTLVAVGPLCLVALNFYANGMYFAPPARYGIGLVAGMAAVSAVALRRRALSQALAVVGAVSVLVAIL